MDKIEILHLSVSWLTISLAFAIAVSNLMIAKFISIFPMLLIIVGTAFVLHELAHRFTAIKLGCYARYKAWTLGLIMALVLSISGFVFAAPGAVYIYGSHITRKQNGIISLSGALTNIIIAIIFFIMLFLTRNSFLLTLASWGFGINIFLALFNLVPIPPLDGSKVFYWSPKIWYIIFIPLAIVFTIVWIL